MFLNIHRKHLRISRDWVGNQWVDIEAKPDILSALSAAISPDAKISTSLISCKDAAILGPKVPTSTTQNVVEEKLDSAAPVSSNGFPEDMDCDNEMKQQPSQEDRGGGNFADHVTDCHNNNDNLDEDHRGNDNEENSNNDEDDDDNGRESDLEDFENARQKCVAVELMEVVA